MPSSAAELGVSAAKVTESAGRKRRSSAGCRALRLLCLAASTTACHASAVRGAEDFNSCLQASWVVYRSHEARARSFSACRLSLSGVTWLTASDACHRLGSSLATLVNYNELRFYYDAFQLFPISYKETGRSRPATLAAYVNIRDLKDEGRTVYEYYDRRTGVTESRPWTFYGDLPIPVYTPAGAAASRRSEQPSALQCAVLHMSINHVAHSYVEFGLCNETRTDLFLCRKERSRCGEVPRDLYRLDNVERIVGTYSSYESNSIQGQRVPKKRYVIERTKCEKSCRGKQGSSGWVYYEGDTLTYWCAIGSSASGNETRLATMACTASNWSTPQACRRLMACPRNRRDFSCANAGLPYTAASAPPTAASVAVAAGNDTELPCFCQCPAGRTGGRCEAATNDCQSNPCKNGGTCRRADERSGGGTGGGGGAAATAGSGGAGGGVGGGGAGGYVCACAGAVGEHCEFEINECASAPCVGSGGNDTWCIDELNGYRCVCPVLREGKHCEQDVPYCTVYAPCENGADCWSCNLHIFQDLCARANASAYVCSCGPDFAGRRCETAVARVKNPWQIFAMVLGAILFVIVALACEIIGSRRRSEIDNLQVLLEAIGAFLKKKRAASAPAPSKDTASVGVAAAPDPPSGS